MQKCCHKNLNILPKTARNCAVELPKISPKLAKNQPKTKQKLALETAHKNCNEKNGQKF